MLIQINKPFTIYLLSGIFNHFLRTLPKQDLNNFCPQDYLKVVKHRDKSTSDTYLLVLFMKASHTRFIYKYMCFKLLKPKNLFLLITLRH